MNLPDDQQYSLSPSCSVNIEEPIEYLDDEPRTQILLYFLQLTQGLLLAHFLYLFGE